MKITDDFCLELFDGQVLRYKFTLRELDNHFIATFWDPSSCLEVDREIIEFETYSGALVCVYEMALEKVLNHSTLRQEVT